MREGYNRQENIDQFLQELDDAPSLCCFNGIRFDIPFIIARFSVPQVTYPPITTCVCFSPKRVDLVLTNIAGEVRQVVHEGI